MKIHMHRDYDEMSARTAEHIIEYVNNHAGPLICLAAGDTPRGVYEKLVQAYESKRVTFGHCKFVGLDEWVGLDKTDRGSCQYTLYNQFLNKVNLKEAHITFFDSKAASLSGECNRVDQWIQDNGPVDLFLLGLGQNGHLGFNEPGASWESYSHVIELDELTKNVGQKYFDEPRLLTQGITLGLRHILESETVILIANGSKKAEAIRKTVLGETMIEVPSTMLQKHAKCFIHLDETAGSLLMK